MNLKDMVILRILLGVPIKELAFYFFSTFPSALFSTFKSLPRLSSLVCASPSAGPATVSLLVGRACDTEPGLLCFHLISMGFSFHLYRPLSVSLETALVCMPVKDL